MSNWNTVAPEGAFKDDYTRIIKTVMDEFEDRIYQMEENLESIEDNEEAIVAYLKDIRCSMPLGLALRRYLCGKFAQSFDEAQKQFVFTLSDGTQLPVGDYRQENYDICNDDVKEYVDIFMDINAKYNTSAEGVLVCDFTKAEARRMIRMTKVCQRSKMFLLSFALHMDSREMFKFLTDVLAEPSYSYRDPDEIIAYYCHTHEEVNNYIDYLRMKAEFEKRLSTSQIESRTVDNYTRFARRAMTIQVETEEDLYRFLLENNANLHGYSQTIYREFMQMYQEAMDGTRIQLSSNDELLMDYSITSDEQRRERQSRLDRALGLRKPENSEQLAKEMLRCIPRYTSERMKDGEKIITHDFISISNGEAGQKGKKAQTTTLPKEITMNLLMSDRLEDLRNQKKPVTRKDLVFMKFYNFGLYLQSKESYSSGDYHTFLDECNEMLMRCGMSRLYPANRFENLVLLSLVSSNPFEMFESIIENSIIAEPTPEEERLKFEKGIREIDYLIKGMPKPVRREIVACLKSKNTHRANRLMQENGRAVLFPDPDHGKACAARTDELLKEDNMSHLMTVFGCAWEDYKPR